MARLVHEDFFNQIFEDNFKGMPVRFIKNKFTGAISINADDCCRCLGYGSVNDLLSTDKELDIVGDWMRDNPGKSVFGKHGSGAMFEEARFYQ